MSDAPCLICGGRGQLDHVTVITDERGNQITVTNPMTCTTCAGTGKR